MFLVAATGGLEEPSFLGTLDFTRAKRLFESWSEDLISEPGDRVDLLQLDDIGYTTIINSTTYEWSD